LESRDAVEAQRIVLSHWVVVSHWPGDDCTVGGHVQVRKEAVGIGLTEIVAIQVENRETDGPKHDFPVDLPNQSLQTC